MNLFHSRSPRRLRPAWTYTARGVLWRLVPAGEERIVGEGRDLQKKEVAFFCLDIRTGRPLWQPRAFGERWWTGIEAVHEGVLLVHRFVTPELPEHRGIAAVALKSGDVLWEVPDVTYLSVREHSISAVRKTPVERQVVELDLSTGETISSRSLSEFPMPSEAAVSPPGVFAPSIVSDIGSDPIASYLRCAGGRDVEGPVEQLIVDDLAIVGFHDRGISGGPMQQTVAVIDTRTGELVYSEKTDTQLRAVVPGTFCVCGSMLLFIRERRALVGIQLPKREE